MNTQEAINNEAVCGGAQDRQKKVSTPEFRAQVIGVYKSGVYDSVLACAKAYAINSKTLTWYLGYDGYVLI